MFCVGGHLRLVGQIIPSSFICPPTPATRYTQTLQAIGLAPWTVTTKRLKSSRQFSADNLDIVERLSPQTIWVEKSKKKIKRLVR